MLESSIDDIKGVPQQSLINLARETFEHRLKHWIYTGGFELVQEARKRKHHVVLVTPATRYQAQAIADLFGFDDMFCTELGIIANRIAGGVAPCFGARKLSVARWRGGAARRSVAT